MRQTSKAATLRLRHAIVRVEPDAESALVRAGIVKNYRRLGMSLGTHQGHPLRLLIGINVSSEQFHTFHMGTTCTTKCVIEEKLKENY